MAHLPTNPFLRSRVLAATVILLATVLVAAPALAQPTAVDDDYNLTQGGTLTVEAPGVLINDLEPNRLPLTAILVTGPSFAASFSLMADGTLSYTHDGSTNAFDSFTYQVSNGSETSEPATVSLSIAITSGGIPEASDDAYSVVAGGSVNVPSPGVLENDQAANEGGTLTANLLTAPQFHAGTFTLNADGSFFYQHDGGGEGSDSFTYEAIENGVASNVATVSITIGASEPQAATINLHFGDVETVRYLSEVGTIETQRFAVAAASGDPALVSGSGLTLPATTTRLIVQARDAAAIPALLEVLHNCHKQGLLAQSRPDKYDFEVTIGVSDAGQVDIADTELVAVTVADGSVQCSVVRVQNAP